MTLKFIYWRKSNKQDGLSPYSISILKDMVNLVNKGIISFYITFPVNVEESDTYGGYGDLTHEEKIDYQKKLKEQDCIDSIEDGYKQRFSITEHALELARRFVDSGSLKRTERRFLPQRDGYMAAVAKFKKDFVLTALQENDFNVKLAAKKIKVNRKTIYRVVPFDEIRDKQRRDVKI